MVDLDSFFVRLKLMPFSIMSPWVRGFEREISGFLFTWFLVDTFVAFIFSVDAWVAIVDSRKSGREIVKEKTEKHSPTSLNVKNELKIRRCSNCYYNAF